MVFGLVQKKAVIVFWVHTAGIAKIIWSSSAGPLSQKIER